MEKSPILLNLKKDLSQSCLGKSCTFTFKMFRTLCQGKEMHKRKKNKKALTQNHVLNDYFSKLYQKFISEDASILCSFSTFAGMRQNNFVLANFENWKKICHKIYKYIAKIIFLQMKYLFTQILLEPTGANLRMKFYQHTGGQPMSLFLWS